MERSRTTKVSEIEANAVRDVALTTYNGESKYCLSFAIPVNCNSVIFILKLPVTL